jgi:hypothetical protein
MTAATQLGWASGISTERFNGMVLYGGLPCRERYRPGVGDASEHPGGSHHSPARRRLPSESPLGCGAPAEAVRTPAIKNHALVRRT